MRLSLLHLFLQRLDRSLHLIDLRLNLLHILRFGFPSPGRQKSDNARADKQIAVQFSQSPVHVPPPTDFGCDFAESFYLLGHDRPMTLAQTYQHRPQSVANQQRLLILGSY